MSHLKIRILLAAVIFGFIMMNSVPLLVHCQDKNFIAIIPPFIDRQHSEELSGALRLARQRFIIFLYRNAAAVYSEADFMNSGNDSLTVDIALPSTGFQEKNNTSETYTSNGILSVRLWVAGEPIEPEILQEGDTEWYAINTIFPPSIETKVKALFWVQTSLTDIDSLPGIGTIKIRDGRRGLLLDLSQAEFWRDDIGLFEATIVFQEGLTASDTLDANPDNYEVGDSTINWTMRNIEPSADDNISLYYNSAVKQKPRMNTMKKISELIVRKIYDNLLEYVRQLDEE